MYRIKATNGDRERYLDCDGLLVIKSLAHPYTSCIDVYQNAVQATQQHPNHHIEVEEIPQDEQKYYEGLNPWMILNIP